VKTWKKEKASAIRKTARAAKPSSSAVPASSASGSTIARAGASGPGPLRGVHAFDLARV
jgi:hypothetical protein